MRRLIAAFPPTLCCGHSLATRKKLGGGDSGKGKAPTGRSTPKATDRFPSRGPDRLQRDSWKTEFKNHCRRLKNRTRMGARKRLAAARPGCTNRPENCIENCDSSYKTHQTLDTTTNPLSASNQQRVKPYTIIATSNTRSRPFTVRPVQS